MGVRGYLNFVSKIPNLSAAQESADLTFLDGNCFLHKFVANLDHFLDWEKRLEEITLAVISGFDKLFSKYRGKIIVVFDGIPPHPKQYRQKERRNNSCSLAVFLLPGTFLMSHLQRIIVSKYSAPNRLFSLSTEEGEGEQKIFEILRRMTRVGYYRYRIVSYDSDVVILSQILVWTTDVDIVVEIPTLKSRIKTIGIKKLNKFFSNNHYDITKLMLLCSMSGNDFLPKIKEVSYLQKTFTMIKTGSIKCYEDLARPCGGCRYASQYVSILRWYIGYFLAPDTNESAPRAEDIEDVPCCRCIVDEVRAGKINVIQDAENSGYLENVLSVHAVRKNLLCQNGLLLKQ